MDLGAWQAAVYRVAKGWTQLKQLSMYADKQGSEGLNSEDSPSLPVREMVGTIFFFFNAGWKFVTKILKNYPAIPF